MKQRKQTSYLTKLLCLLFACVLASSNIQPAVLNAKVVNLDPKAALVDMYSGEQIAMAEFKSGGSTHTHQYIVAQAVNVLKNDQGSSIFNNSAYLNSLKIYTDWPDKVGNESDTATYAGHFYNPYTGENWMGKTSPTALSRAISYYNKAVSAYKSGDVEAAIEYIGKGSHYVGDLNEPHHASNLTALNSNHSAFEKYVDENRTSFYISGNTLDDEYYLEAKTFTMTKILKDGAFYAYDLKYMAQDEDTYYKAGKLSVQHAIMNTVQYFYKFGVAVGIFK